MDIVMPVAGLGTRLRPQTWSKPKPLVTVAGRPMLSHVLDRLTDLDPDHLVFITGYLGDHIKQWISDNYDVPTVFVVQPEMKGQTDAILRVRDHVRNDALVLFPDMLFEADFSRITESSADVIMYTKEVDDPSALGVAVVESGRIIKLVEKPTEPVSNLAVIGIYYFRHMPDLYDAIEEQMRLGISLKNEFFIADAIQLMIDKGKVVEPALVSEWRDCGNDHALLDTNRYLLDQMATTAAIEGSVVIPPSFVDPSATIEHAVVGPYASIGANAIVRNAIVNDSIVDEGATVEEVHLVRSIVGRGAHVSGAATELNVSDLSMVKL